MRHTLKQRPNLENQIFDPIRKIWVEALPEEIVRQSVLRHMIQDLGFVTSLIAVEREIALLPHLDSEKSKNRRRMDILSYAKDIHPLYPLYPLLLVECKAEELTEVAIEQAIGYNQIVKAYFLAIACKNMIKTFWSVGGNYTSCEFLPSYQELIKAVKDRGHFYSY